MDACKLTFGQFDELKEDFLQDLGRPGASTVS